MKPTSIAVCALLSFSGCGASKQTDQAMAGLRTENAVMKADQERLLRRLEDLSNSLLVLQDRVETLQLALDQQHPAAPPKPVSRRSLPREEEGETFLIEPSPSVRDLPALQFTNRDLAHMDKTLETSPPPEAARPSADPSDHPEATRMYNEAFGRFEAGDYPGAIESLDAFVRAFPRHPYADNAAFWSGEGYFRQKDFKNAAARFERVAKEFPAGNKVPDALLRAGSCYLHLSRPQEAQQAFQHLIDSYPKSVAAQKAKSWLADLNRKSSKGRT